jgi:ubiquinone/menaquinone biosynthesis C-methylase UbiE
MKKAKTIHPWTQIPLPDYEKHMTHETVGQLQLLSQLTKQKLAHYNPQSFAILGVCGGNGFEHIDNAITSFVYGIDINTDYLKACKERFGLKIPHLKLMECDVNKKPLPRFDVNLFWAALIFEYIDMDKGLAQINKNLKDKGSLVVVIQKNNGATSVSPTGVEAIKKAGEVFNLVDETLLIDKAKRMGLIQHSRTEHFLPNGKSFICLDFLKKM